jgi:hypothetical protein
MVLLEKIAGVAEAECALCGDMEPNAETIEALEELERAKRDPSLHRGYTSAKELFAGIRANVDY